MPDVLTPELYAGVMFLCCLPSTVQSSIAFTSIAKGNVAAAICSASFSNLIGIVLTPVLVTVFLVTQTGGGVSLAAIRDILPPYRSDTGRLPIPACGKPSVDQERRERGKRNR